MGAAADLVWSSNAVGAPRNHPDQVSGPDVFHPVEADALATELDKLRHG